MDLRIMGALLGLWVLPASKLMAQGQVIVVDEQAGAGSDFVALGDALAAAQDDDVLLIRAGNYGSVGINDKALTLVAEVNAVVHVGSIRITSLLAGKRIVLLGLIAQSRELFPTLTVTDCQGAVLVQDCALDKPEHFFQPGASCGASVSNSASVTFVRTTIEGSGNNVGNVAEGLRLTASTAHLYDSEVRGGRGNDAILILPPEDGADGILLTSGSTLFASGSLITGGDGGNNFVPCFDAADGGDGLFLGTDNPTVFLVDTMVNGGAAGQQISPCAAGSPGLERRITTGGVNVRPVALARGLEIGEVPVRPGGPVSVTFTGNPGDFYFWLVSPGLNPVLLLEMQGVLLPALPVSYFLFGPLPLSGTATFPYTAPPIAPGFDYDLLFHQGLFFEPSSRQYVLSGGQVSLTVP